MVFAPQIHKKTVSWRAGRRRSLRTGVPPLRLIKQYVQSCTATTRADWQQGSSIIETLKEDQLWSAYIDTITRLRPLGTPPPPSLFQWCKMRRILKGLDERYTPGLTARWCRGGFGRRGPVWQPLPQGILSSAQLERIRHEREVAFARRDGLPFPPANHAEWVIAEFTA